MKSSDRRKIYDEHNKAPRETQYEVEIFIQTHDGIEPYDAFLTRQPPQLPDEGEEMSFSWIENEDEEEVFEPIDPNEIGSDEEYTAASSHKLKVKNKSTTYSKRNYKTEEGTERLLVIEKTVTLDMSL